MAEKEYIEREAVIKKLNEIGGCDASNDWNKGWNKAIDMAVKAIEKLPAADVIPKASEVKHKGYTFIQNANNHFSLVGSDGKTYLEYDYGNMITKDEAIHYIEEFIKVNKAWDQIDKGSNNESGQCNNKHG